MKRIAIAAILTASFGANAQIKTPALSPLGEVEQTVGLTEIDIEYSRPSKRGRTVFTDIVPYGEVWRAGANKNTTIVTDDHLVFGKDTLKAGSYAIFIKPEAAKWTVYFYANTENWGTPEKWDDKLVAVKVEAPVQSGNVVETFTIGFDKVEIDGAHLTFAWDKTHVSVPFKVINGPKVEASIKATLSGKPTAGDYYRAADYYVNSNGDMKQALEWMNKSIELSGENVPFYFLRKKALIQANLKDFKGAIETAKLSSEAAKKANNEEYVKMNEASIKEWSKK
ncbi:DUF2911 domain-containing protein [Crocinitomicaceae bacterium CZZ-1]|uniref:DUF2911 domain-containing protein n=1 Tax=Taishania pollutisoli TaxID=2766479 RepID=A0A8J6P839_9FLAO|nr:DUF2911 domain-containing protein [Taishania pollutisoli]MBC9813849.1 DUF2911 domain-containing protein [Taishania pollutisoli]MBX2948140.1 DUF2911 domain-containing protein [Crocinitomicaceae bacterium]NGF77361.1 DUF2911 domain-containing protein [Fluviicola sp. SGL-29]